MTLIRAVLFDLDGTLVDTAPDLLYALNQVRAEHALPPLPLSEFRSITNLGAKAMMKLGFGVDEDEHQYAYLRERFIAHYMHHVADSTQLFPQMDQVLHHLDQQKTPWGIVTNKTTKPTLELLKALNLLERAACVVCGDTLSTCKPDPAPILHACELIDHAPEQCLYVGDAPTDVIASKAAGTKSLVATYGYIHHLDDPKQWEADGYIDTPIELITWLTKFQMIESA